MDIILKGKILRIEARRLSRHRITFNGNRLNPAAVYFSYDFPCTIDLQIPTLKVTVTGGIPGGPGAFPFFAASVVE